MKRYLILLLSALFGLAPMAPAAKPDDVKKGKQKAAAQVQRQAVRPPAAVKKSSNFSNRSFGGPARHQVNPQFKKNQSTFAARSNANLRVNKPVNTYNRQVAAQRNWQNQNKINNATADAQRARRNQNVNNIAARNWQNQQNANNAEAAARVARLNRNPGNLGAERNWQNHNNANNAALAAQRANRNRNPGNRGAERNWQNQNDSGNYDRSRNWNRNRNWNSLSFYEANRRRHRGHHNRNWWRSWYGTNIILFGSGYYYLDSGYWYPAYGYDPVYSTYEYDGPIYGYNNLPPGEVVTNVQAALQQQGYYHGSIDGSIGPLTRSALRRYQRDNGLEITGAIDEPTLVTLGLT